MLPPTSKRERERERGKVWRGWVRALWLKEKKGWAWEKWHEGAREKEQEEVLVIALPPFPCQGERVGAAAASSMHQPPVSCK